MGSCVCVAVFAICYDNGRRTYHDFCLSISYLGGHREVTGIALLDGNRPCRGSAVLSLAETLDPDSQQNVRHEVEVRYHLLYSLVSAIVFVPQYFVVRLFVSSFGVWRLRDLLLWISICLCC
jgi:hypothetical protein